MADYLKSFVEDCKFYDPDSLELKAILSNTDLKGKSVLDIGSGIGRLSFPLAKFASQVVALDSDKRLSIYYSAHKRKNLTFVNQKAEKYLDGKKNFDIVLLAWPTINPGIITYVKKAMRQNSIFIFAVCDNNSDFETIVDCLGLFEKSHFDQDNEKKKKFIQLIQENFKLFKKEILHTRYVYPDKKTAFRVLKNDMKIWYNLDLDDAALERLNLIINRHKKGKKIMFKEEAWFYFMKNGNS